MYLKLKNSVIIPLTLDRLHVSIPKEFAGVANSGNDVAIIRIPPS
jgi:hypothetical protein